MIRGVHTFLKGISPKVKAARDQIRLLQCRNQARYHFTATHSS